MDEPPSSLLKSRIPRKTIIVDPVLVTCKSLLYIYLTCLNTILHLADSTALEFTTFIVLFKRESFTIAGAVRYSSTTSIPPENMRLVHMLLIKKSYTTHCLQATNYCPETSVSETRNIFVRPHQWQPDPTTRKVLWKDNCKVLWKDNPRDLPTLSTPINPRNPIRKSCWSCSVVFQRLR